MKYTVKVSVLLVVLLCSMSWLHAQTSTTDLLLTANKFHELKLYKKAIIAYKEVLQKDPNLGETYGKLANSYRLTNDLPNASSWYIRAVQLSSANPEYFFQYGLVLKGLQQYDQAKLYFQEFAKVDAIRGNHFAASCDFAKKNINSASFYTIMNEAANSAKSDFGASFYGDKVVYASSRNDIKNNSNDKQQGWQEGLFNQLFIATPAANAQLGTPNLLRSGLATRLNEGPVSYAANGRMVAYTGNNYIDGIRKIPEADAKLRIYFADVKSANQWGKATPFAYNNPEKYNTAFPSLNSEGSLMYFASDKEGGFGGYDLYYSVKNGTTWSSPVNLGPQINTAGDEITPFISGNVLYFSSDRHYGFGGFDVFRTEKISGEWDRVQHLGKGVNSSYDDYFFAFNGLKNIGYVTSNRPGGKGGDDLYSVRSSAEKIELVVLSAATNQPIVGAKVDFTSCGEGIASTNANGRFKFLALQGLKCQVTISKGGFEPKTIKISSANKSQRLVEIRLVSDQPLRGKYVGTIVDIASQKAVPNVLVTAKNMATQRTLETYTDSKGMYAFDLEPSTTYLVRYSKSNYTTTNKTVDTGDGSDRAILGALSFEKSAVIADKPVKKVETTRDVPMSKKIPKIAYEIQIGAFSNPDKAKFNELRKLGYVYSQKKGTYSVYKVGAYRTKSQANAIKEKIAAKGFKDAFVTVLNKPSLIKRVLVGGELENPIDETDESPVDENPVDRTPPTKPITKPVVDVKPTTSKGVVFKVQLGAYRNPKFFDQTKVADLGTIDLKPINNGLTLILLGDFQTYKKAKSMVGQVEQRGLPKPLVVAYKDGKKVSLKSVM